MAGSILDASAFLAYLRDEPGADVVAEAIAEGTAMSPVNLAEVLSRAADRGSDPRQLVDDLTDRGVLHGAVQVEAVTVEDAVEVARLRPRPRAAGLSLGDRSCLALAARLGLPVFTADAAWIEVGLDLDLRMIR